MTDTTSVRAARKRLDPFESVFQVAYLNVKRSFKGWRAFIALAVVLLPAGLALLVRKNDVPEQHQEEFFYHMLGVYHFGIAVPFVALLFATGFPWPEAEEGTLTYWFTSPVARWTVLLGRYAATLVVGSLVLCVGLLAFSLPLSLRPQAEIASVVGAATACTLLAFPAYLALFQLVATWWRWGLILGVLFILLENFMSFITGSIVHLTILFYVRSHLWPSIPEPSRGMAQRLFSVVEPASHLSSLTVFAGVTAVALGLSLFLVSVIEYRGKTSQPG